MEDLQKEELLRLIKKFNKEKGNEFKIVYIDEAYWNNAITKKKGVVKDIFFLGIKNSSEIPKCILSFYYDEKEYEIHDYLNHINISRHISTSEIVLGDKKLIMRYQSFCNPVMACQVYSKPNIEKILKGQLSGQNGNSPFQEVENVINDGYDACVIRRDRKKMTCKNSVAELLTRYTPGEIRTITAEKLDLKPIPQNDNEIAIKLKENGYYTIITKDTLDSLRHRISEYYPIITYEDCKDMLDNIPKQDVDLTVIGLGSAGTGILDQVARSTYFNNYLLIDFDEVEEKNIRNQWYIRNYLGSGKAYASKEIIKGIKTGKNIIAIDSKFQNAKLNHYKTKYVISGFDNLECRMELLNKCLSSFEARYLIDLRYLDYTSSIYFIDLQNEQQVKYYRNLLQADIDAFEEIKKEKEKHIKYIETKEELDKYWEDRDFYRRNCCSARREFFCKCESCGLNSCASIDCKELLWKEFQESQAKIPLNNVEENSCIKENFIDIYKYSSSFVFAAIREIEDGNEKPFTHIEAQTEGIPNSVIIKR